MRADRRAIITPRAAAIAGREGVFCASRNHSATAGSAPPCRDIPPSGIRMGALAPHCFQHLFVIRLTDSEFGMLPGIKQFDLTGKVAIVTGGSKGLGQAI